MIYFIIIAAYVFCHGLIALVVTPVQSIILPDITVFASLIYLPHGVRVLATWAIGWKAVPALVVGAILSVWIFSPSEDVNFLEPALLEGILVGSASAFVAFEIARLVGFNVYFGGARKLKWKGLIAVGALSSVVNSVGQTLVYSGIIDLDKVIGVWAVYAIGDLIGLIVCMVALMFIFRWSRVRSTLKAGSD
ncbi:hypothetical protein [Actibacterium pelagium]|uniref:Uncharacterized protein n=1 Tax=Actibacterium pelagium TaxID=2029103 RepID=A0A917AGE7_9RHOB|nr:hypothetical protein [Actibacterium pelagium]GGE46648.1 hypothetical protein GCM10011517_12940 [Actibacterium pelagium]